MNNNINLRVMFIALISFTCLTGFIDFNENPESEIVAFIQTTQSTMRPTPDLGFGELPEVGNYEPSTYNIQATSPFKLREFVTDNSVLADEDSPTAHCQSADCGDGPPAVHAPYFLESFDITELSMVGTILDDNKQRVALIQTPAAGIVNAARGEYLGKNNGMIVTIEEDHIVVREKYKVPLGWQNRMAILELFN